MLTLLKDFKLSALGVILFVIPFIYPQKINASNYWTCENEDGFVSVFKINTYPASITHISSYDSKNGDKWSVNQPLQVVFSNRNIISSVDVIVEEESKDPGKQDLGKRSSQEEKGECCQERHAGNVPNT